MRKNKYNNKKNVYKGIKFDSIRERDRYIYLLTLEKAYAIEDISIHPSFEISEGGFVDPATGKKMRARRYIADFMYTISKTGEVIVEDVKSKITAKNPLYRIKRQLFIEKYSGKYRFIETY